MRFLILLILTVAPVFAQELPPELPDDDPFVTGSPELSEEDTVAALEALDQEVGRPDEAPTEAQVAELADELGHEMWVEDREMYDRVFARYKTERMPLSADQEYYHRIAMSRLSELRMPHKDEISNLLRFYIFLLSDHEGMSFAGATRFEPNGRSYSAGVGHGGYIPGVLDQFPSTLVNLIERLGWTRFPTRTVPTGTVRTFLGIEMWEITRNEPDTSRPYLPNVGYARQVSAFLRRYTCGNGLRGIRESDLMVVWLLDKYPEDFFTDRIREWAQQAWPDGVADPRVLAAEIYTCKTTPSLAFNNDVARKIAEPISWEALGMPTDGIYNRLARFSHEHPVLTNLIPIYGACWRAASSLIDCYEGRDASGAQLGTGGRALAAGSFLFNWAMAVSDVYLVKGIAQVTVRGAAAGANAAGRLLPESARQALGQGRAVAQRVYARMMQTTMRAVPTGGVNAARAVRAVLARQLKHIRNATIAPPAAIAQRARDAALRRWQEMKEIVKINEKFKKAGEDFYHFRSVASAVDRTTGKTYTGINASGAVRGAIQANGATSAHPRLLAIRNFIQRVTGRPTMKSWSFENCAEWEAVNSALQDGAKMEDLVVFVTKNASGKPFPCCLNCRLTTLGSAVLSNNDQWVGQLLGGLSGVNNTAQGVTSITAGRGRSSD